MKRQDQNLHFCISSIVLFLSFGLWSCSNLSPIDSSKQDSDNSHDMIGNLTESGTFERDQTSAGFGAGTIVLSDGTRFTVKNGAMKSPETNSLRKEVTITVDMEWIDSETLRLTFGPAGTTFDPPAEIDVEWLNAQSANFGLYYIEGSGNRISQPTEDIAVGQDSVKLYIHHFSEYELDDE